MRPIFAVLASLSFIAAAHAADAPHNANNVAAAKTDKPSAPVKVQEWSLVKDRSSLHFVAIENGAPVEGKFTDFTTDVKFDPDHLDQSVITASVNTGSLASDNKDVMENLKLPEWLAFDKFPTATFKSGKLSRMPMTDNYYTEGDLTIKGKKLPVVMNFQIKTYGDTDIVEGYMTVKRIAYKVGEGQWAKDDVIKDDVRVEFRVVEQKK